MDLPSLKYILDTRTIAVENLVKVKCQDLVIEQLKRNIERLENENKTLSRKVEKHEVEYRLANEKEIKLTSERDVLKESLKRTQFDLEKANKKVDAEHAKKQKIRKSYQILSRSVNGDSDEIKRALEDMKEGLMN